ncbi:MAG: hypothetical protein ACHQJ6_03145 [Candidatus Berkiellales bacterium]
MLKVILPVLSSFVLFYQTGLFAKSDNNFNDMDHVTNKIAEKQKHSRLIFETHFVDPKHGCDICNQWARPNGEPSFNFGPANDPLLKEHR